MMLLSGWVSQAQTAWIKGVVKDKQSDEPIPFASAVCVRQGIGALTDSSGKFAFQVPSLKVLDTLEIRAIGYQPARVPFSIIKDSLSFTVFIEVLPPSTEAVVKVKYNRALWFWRKIMANKNRHDKKRWDHLSYEIYNKLELDLDNVNKDKLSKNPLLKPLNFVFSYIDSTSENKPFLPVYITETLSDYYWQNKPRRTREVIKATQTNGLENEGFLKQLGGTYQNINVYEQTIPVFDKTFISPFHVNADNYYQFKLLDTQYLNKKRLVHLSFKPKRKGEDTFEGDAWIHDTSFAVQKITLRPQLDANINFVTGLSLIQEFRLVQDSVWFLYKDKFVADLAPLGEQRIGFKGRKTTTYRNVVFNDTSIERELAKSKLSEDIVLVRPVDNKPDSFWQQTRHEPLNKTEQAVYQLLDTLIHNPTYLRYRNIMEVLTTGTKDIGNIRIGPWYYWLTGNVWEGTRMRFDLATNRGFSHHWHIKGYAAYGFRDAMWKGRAELKYLFSRQPWTYLSLSYKSDLDNGQVYYDQLGSDNLFALFARKPGVPFKFQQITEKKLSFFAETNKGFSFAIDANSKFFKPLLNLPAKNLFPVSNGEPLNTFEASLRLRYAYQEHTIEDNFERISLGSELPIVQLSFTKGIAGVLNSSYNYHKLDLTLTEYTKLAPYGSLYTVLFAGKTYGTLPYQLLDMQPGNEWRYYSRYSFNLMNRFEYLTDRYAGFMVEHNIGSGIFRLLSPTRKLKLRQFWTLKSVIGDLSPANQQLNFVGNHPFRTLDGKMYTEIGTGIDNIFKFFRVDFVWRLNTGLSPKLNQEKFGVFFGFRVAF